MDEPKIVLALEKFKADYAWDKSLVVCSTNSTTPSSRPPDFYTHTSGAAAIEEFINGGK